MLAVEGFVCLFLFSLFLRTPPDHHLALSTFALQFKMGFSNLKLFSKSTSPVSSIEQPEPKVSDDVPVQHQYPTPTHGMHGIEVDERTRLHRNLKARHISMIAIGGAIGTGLIIGTGAALARAGPASIFISYTLVGGLVYLVMCALGEMAAWLPLSSGFTGYATRFCDPALGFALGWTSVLSCPSQEENLANGRQVRGKILHHYSKSIDCGSARNTVLG